MGSAQSAVRTPGQNRQIHGLVARIAKASGLGRDEIDPLLRRLAREASGQEHTSQLTSSQAGYVIGKLERELAGYGAPPAAPVAAPHAPWAPRGEGPREGVGITPRQQYVIAALYALVGWSERARQIAFCQRQCKVPWPQTQLHADAVITPLSAIALRQVRPREIWDRFQALDGDTRLTRWEAGFVADVCAQYSAADASGRLDKVLTPHKLAKLFEVEGNLEGRAR